MLLDIEDYEKLLEELEELEALRAFDAAEASGDKAIPLTRQYQRLNHTNSIVFSFSDELKRNCPEFS